MKNIVDFFTKNYEWIFSGIGVLAITYFLRVFRRKGESGNEYNVADKQVQLTESNNNNINLVTNQINNNLVTNQISNNYQQQAEETKLPITNIDPVSIKNEIKNAPLFQQKAIASHYVGLYIKWNINLFSIHIMKGSNIVNVSCLFGDRMFPDIVFNVDIDKYPFLKISKRGKLFEIAGKIISCNAREIEIEIDDLLELN